MAEGDCSRQQPKHKPRKGSVETKIAPSTRPVKRQHGGDRTVVLHFRCERTGIIGPLRDHVDALSRIFTRASPLSIRNALTRHGEFYGYIIEPIGEAKREESKTAALYRTRVLLTRTPNVTFAINDVVAKLGVSRNAAQRSLSYLALEGAIERIELGHYQAVVAHV